MTTDGLSKRAQRFERSEGHRAHSTKRNDSKELQRLQMKMQKLCREQEHSHSSRSTFLLISHTCYFLDSDINELFMLMNHFSNAANPGLTLRLKLFPIMLFFSRLAAACLHLTPSSSSFFSTQTDLMTLFTSSINLLFGLPASEFKLCIFLWTHSLSCTSSNPPSVRLTACLQSSPQCFHFYITCYVVSPPFKM